MSEKVHVKKKDIAAHGTQIHTFLNDTQLR